MTEQFSFNLVDEAWLPCVTLAGEANVLSLRQVLTQAHQLKTLAGDSPPQTAALHRLLLAILHRVFGPDGADTWESLWQATPFEAEAIHDYLDTWQPRFDLFDAERPFYQAPDKRVKSKSVISLSHDRAAGNNATLFDHHTEAEGEMLTPAQAACALVTAQAFGLAGLAGIKGATFTDGTCAGGIIFLVEGDNLKQTLLLNMVMYPTDDDIFAHDDDDIPAWEMDDPLDPDRETPIGYLDYLTWQNRRILFEPESMGGEVVVRSMTMGPALRIKADILDTMKHYRKDEKLGALATNFSEDKVLWRDSATFLSFGKIGDLATPKTLGWLRHLVTEQILRRGDIFRAAALGMSKKQAKVFFFREERLPLPLAYLTDDDLVNTLADALNRTATLAFDVVQATRRMGMFLQIPDADSKKWGELNGNAKSDINNWVAYTGVERTYWAALEVPFQIFMVSLAQKEREPVLKDWFTMLHRTAWDAFEQATQYAGNDGKSFKAVERGRSYLGYRLSEIFPKEDVVQSLD
ncbi:MAG: type I-E CRISPR-associated protein Cse1/CasA [Anaerolineae bacterium]|nr:type I-E CRISPR-associated protein Cse1/CasA [Anaerolineae bacterium]